MSRSALLRIVALTGLTGLLLTGCIPEEDPIAPFNRGGASETSVPMGSDYSMRLYFDLGTGEIVKQAPITGWDIAFRTDTEGNHIVLNTGQIMAAADMGAVDFASVTSSSGLDWKYDHPSGDWDSTAIGYWWNDNGESVTSKGHVYVIDRGFDAAGKTLGFMKLQMIEATATQYVFRYASLNNKTDETVTISRDMTRNIVGFSFETGEAVEVEPPKDEWDLLFTRYTHIFYDPTFTPYSVTGVLLNRYNTAVALDTAMSFGEVTTENAILYDYSGQLDLIGYDWKTYDFTEGYIIDSPVYLVRDSQGFYYKLLFLDFYNDNGEKGYPKFQMQRL